MSSRGDDVKVGTIKLGEATAQLAPAKPGSPAAAGAGRALALLGLIPLGLGLALHRRRRG
jgi:hypothetical protein